MTETGDQFSDTSSEYNWLLDHSGERQHDDRVVFENVADQYVKGADVTAFFTILTDIKVNGDVDQIGLLRVGCPNIKDCVAYASVEFNPSTTSGVGLHGTATFPSATLSVTDDEFYQFCYIVDKKRNIGTSIPFQLNCAPDDIDILSNLPIRKTKPDCLVALADNDNEDLLVIHSKQALTEEKLRNKNRQLADINRQLETQKDEYKSRFESLETKSKEYTQKIYNEMQTLIASHKTALDELTLRQQSEQKLLSEIDACRASCDRYQADALQYAERCQKLEEAQVQILDESRQLRSQFTITAQLTKEQATKIVELERRLVESNELSKASNQQKSQLEQELRTLHMVRDRVQMELDNHAQEVAQKDEQIKALTTANEKLQDEMNRLKDENIALLSKPRESEELAQTLRNQLDQLSEQHRVQKENAEKHIQLMKGQLQEMEANSQNFSTLTASFNEIKKRCVKHQKSEIEVKRQLCSQKEIINNLQRDIQDLTDRLSAAAEEYKTLHRKCSALEQQPKQSEKPPEKPDSNQLPIHSSIDEAQNDNLDIMRY